MGITPFCPLVALNLAQQCVHKPTSIHSLRLTSMHLFFCLFVVVCRAALVLLLSIKLLSCTQKTLHVHMTTKIQTSALTAHED